MRCIGINYPGHSLTSWTANKKQKNSGQTMVHCQENSNVFLQNPKEMSVRI